MSRLDYLPELLRAYPCDPRSSERFASAYKAVLSGLTVSSSMTSRRYSVWALLRGNFDEALEACIENYKGDWAKELLVGTKVSAMAQHPPLFFAVPSNNSSECYLEAQVVKLDIQQNKPSGMPEVEWQLRNLSRWDHNLRFAIRGLLKAGERNKPEAKMLCGAFQSTRNLFQLLRHFRPIRTTALKGHGVLVDERIRPQEGQYCELCWRHSIRSARLEEIDVNERRLIDEICYSARFSKSTQKIRSEQAWMREMAQYIPRSLALLSKPEFEQINAIFDKFRMERIFAGSLSCRYCIIHRPGSAKYHADLRYRNAFQHHLAVLHGRGCSEFAINLLPPEAADIQELRKLAYDQVHSGLHPVTSNKKKSFGLREKVWIMYLEGISQSEMARRLNISRQAISKAKKSLEGLINTQQAGSYIDPQTGEAAVQNEVREAIQNAMKRGAPIAEIAKEVGLTKGTIEGVIRVITMSS